LADGNPDLRGMRKVIHGTCFDFEDLTLSVSACPDRPGEIRVIGMSRDDGRAGSPRARRRFHACAAAVRRLVAEARPRRIEWRHRGGFYISEAGQIAVVSGMPGTSGDGARRKAAARAFALYGHDATRARPATRRPRAFRIGGDTRQSTPVKLAQWALNATVCVLYLPVGAAVMTHQLLRGGSLNLSARWMAVTGTVCALLMAAQQMGPVLSRLM
jgi:hypothetical protein